MTENLKRKVGRPIDPDSVSQSRLRRREAKSAGTPLPTPRELERKAIMRSAVQLQAQEYTTRAFEILIHIAENGKNDAARVSAANIILDRGHGKVKTQAEERIQQATRIEVIIPGMAQASVQHAQIIRDVIEDQDDDDDDVG